MSIILVGYVVICDSFGWMLFGFPQWNCLWFLRYL